MTGLIVLALIGNVLVAACAGQTLDLVPVGRREMERYYVPPLHEIRGQHAYGSIIAAKPETTGDWILTKEGRHNTVRDLVFEGHKVGGKFYVPNVPKAHHGDRKKYPALYDVNLDANGLRTQNVFYRYIPGEIIFARTSKEYNKGEYDQPENLVRDVNVRHCYGPVRLRAGDATVDNLIVADTREGGIVVESPTNAGHLHAYGCGGPAVAFIGNGSTTGAAVVYGETAPIGLLIEAGGVHLAYFHSRGCYDVCGDIRRPVVIKDSSLDVNDRDASGGVIQTVGYRFHVGSRDSEVAGVLQVRPGCTGVELGASNVRLNLTGGGGACFLKTVASKGVVSNCRITGLISGGEVGLDLRENLGWNNRIDVDVKGIPLEKQVLLPEKPDPRNRIFVNGQQVFPKESPSVEESASLNYGRAAA